MPSPNSDDSAANPVLTAFLQRYLADAKEGRIHDLASYQSLFPGFDAMIEQEFTRLQADSATIPVLAAPALSLTSGGSVGPYRLDRILGRGGYGVVWLATDERLRRPVALKILTKLGLPESEALTRFRREAETASSLDHPGICTVYELGEVDHLAYIALRYIEGRTLAEVLGKAGGENNVRPNSATVHERAHLLERAGLAVAFAHERRVLHRDLKPANIMVTPEGAPVILDFGLARPLDAATLTRPWEVFGTLAYMAPEQIAQASSVDARADVWSLGVTLFECVTGERPFHAPTSQGLLSAILKQDLPDARRLNPAVPRDLVIILETALDRNKDRRYATAREFAEDLRRFRTKDAIIARPSSLWIKTRRWVERRPTLATLVALTALVLPALAAFTAYTLAREPEVQAARTEERARNVAQHVVTGFAELGTFQLDRALGSFEKALALAPDSLEARVGWLTALRRSERLPLALSWLDAHPDFEKTLPCAREFRLLIPDQVTIETDPLLGFPKPTHPIEAWILAARLLRSDEIGPTPRNQQALAYSNRAIILARFASPIYHYQRAEAAGRLQDANAALESATALTRLWPDDAASHFYAGFALLGASLYEGSIRALERCVALNPRWALARSTLAAAFADSDQLDRAAQEFEALIAQGTDEQPAWAAYANILFRKNDFAKAATYYKKAVVLDPTWTSARQRLIDSLIRAEDLTTACKEAAAGVEATKSEVPELLLLHAQLLAETGDLNQAESVLAKAQSVAAAQSPQNPELLRRIAATARQLNN